MKKILLPTDFSEVSENAIRYALEMFGKEVFGDEVAFTLLFDYYPSAPPVGLGVPGIEEDTRLIGQMGKNLSLRCQKWQAAYPGIRMREKFTTGSVKNSIRYIAKKEDMDLIVMGTTGKTGVERVLMGSVATGLAYKAPCPVLIIPAGSRFTRPEKIVFATDFRNLEDLTILDNLLAIVQTFDPDFLMLHMTRKDKMTAEERENIDRVLEIYFDTRKYQRYFLEQEDPATGISDFIAQHQADLLVMVGQERGFFEALFHRSVTKQVLHHSRIPLFVLQKPRSIEQEEIPFREIANEQIDYWKAEFEDLQLQLHLARAEAGDAISKGKELLHQVKLRLDKAENIAEHKWDHFKKEVSDSFTQLKRKIQGPDRN